MVTPAGAIILYNCCKRTVRPPRNAPTRRAPWPSPSAPGGTRGFCKRQREPTGQLHEDSEPWCVPPCTRGNRTTSPVSTAYSQKQGKTPTTRQRTGTQRCARKKGRGVQENSTELHLHHPYLNASPQKISAKRNKKRWMVMNDSSSTTKTISISSSLQSGKYVHSSQCWPGDRSLGTLSSRGCTPPC